MAYSLSFDASLKLKGSNNMGGFLNHFSRETSEVETNHSNKNINSELTQNNMTLVYDTETNQLVECTSHEQIVDAINNRLDKAIDTKTNTYRSTGKVVRSDAVLAYGFIMQLDPQFYEDNSDNPDKCTESISDMIQLATDKFGENIVAVSVHLDESNPHLHFIMTPVTDDNRLSSKEFINSPKLKRIHREFRNKLNDKGYNIDMERRTPENAKRLSDEEYKTLKNLQDKAKSVEDGNKAHIEVECELNSQAYAIDSISMMNDEREEELNQREEADMVVRCKLKNYKSELDSYRNRLDDYSNSLEAKSQKISSDESTLRNEKSQFEAYRASESQKITDGHNKLEIERQQMLRETITEGEKIVAEKNAQTDENLRKSRDIMQKANTIFTRLVNTQDAFLPYAQKYGDEIRGVNREINDFSL